MGISEKAKYYPLYKFLANKKQKFIALDRKKIEEILGFTLPKSSLVSTWWTNVPENGHYHAYSWTDAGFTVSIENDLVCFSR